jgi:vacuolar-type H+-ATPase catalytic subunit A/Vma1
MQHSKETTAMKTKMVQKFQKILSNNNAVLEPVKLNDHHALGVIDAFAKKFKRVLSQEFLENKSTKWIDVLPKIIQQYTSTLHTSLDNITSNDAITDPKRKCM